MRMKKTGCMLLALVMLLGALQVSVVSAQKDEQARVLALVRERIGDTEKYTEFDSSQRSVTNGQTVYRFEWSVQTEDGYSSLSVSCTAGGVITDYYRHDGAATRKEHKPTVHKMPAAEAMVKAKALADKLNPQLSETLVLSSTGYAESLYDTGYTFTLQRTENGIPFYGQSGSVRVNAAVDAIESYYLNYDETLPVPDAQGVISRAAAQHYYAQHLGMELVYKSYTKDRERIIYPVYVPAKPSYLYIDALNPTGGAVDMRSTYPGGIFGTMAGGDAANKNESMQDKEFTEAELKELEQIEGLLDADAVYKAMLSNPLLDIPEKAELTQVQRIKNIYEEAYTYVYRLESRGEKYQSASFSADAKTGALLSYNFYRDYPADAEDKNTVEAAKSAAKALAGSVFEEYRADETYTSETGVRYVRYVNGIPFAQDTISVSVHPQSGKVTNFNLGYTHATFPDIDGAISPTIATEKLFGQVDYDLYYMARYDENGKAHTHLVYVIEEDKPQAIEPFTGKLLNSYSGEEYTETSWTGYTDLEGHYAKTQLETLARFGIRFAQSACRPDDVITQAEYVGLLASAFGGMSGVLGENVETAYREAYNMGICAPQEKAETAPLTREQASVYLIRALGLSEVANLEGIYVCPFADVTENIGYISILAAMGVVRGDGTGAFHPGDTLTRADAAILIYNYLSR